MAQSMKSELKCLGHTIDFKGSQQIKGYLELRKEWEGDLGIPLHFTLLGAEFSIFDRGHKEFFNLETPTTHVEINELRGFKGQEIRFSLKEKPPFVQLREDFLKQYGELKIFQYPIFAGFLGEYLYILFEISRHPLQVGEGFQVVIEKGEGRPYQSAKTCVVKEVTPEFAIIEVTTIVDRQKIYLSALEPAVVAEQSKAVWKIDRANGLKFEIREKGEISQMMRLNQVEVLQKHFIERQITSADGEF